MTGLDHPLVRAYLEGLDRVAAALPDPTRSQLRTDVEEHLLEALPRTQGDDAAVAGVLNRLGSPEDLVAEAGGTPPLARPTPAPAAGRGVPRLEAAALVVLLLSVVLVATLVLAQVAPLFWVAGIVLLLLSDRWSMTDKALGVLAYGILGMPLVFFSLFTAASPFGASEGCTSGRGPDGVVVVGSCRDAGPPAWWWLVVAGTGLALLALWVGTAVRLYRRAARPAPEPERGLRLA
jgi:hypothetical protein